MVPAHRGTLQHLGSALSPSSLAFGTWRGVFCRCRYRASSYLLSGPAVEQHRGWGLWLYPPNLLPRPVQNRQGLWLPKSHRFLDVQDTDVSLGLSSICAHTGESRTCLGGEMWNKPLFFFFFPLSGAAQSPPVSAVPLAASVPCPLPTAARALAPVWHAGCWHLGLHPWPLTHPVLLWVQGHGGDKSLPNLSLSLGVCAGAGGLSAPRAGQGQAGGSISLLHAQVAGCLGPSPGTSASLRGPQAGLQHGVGWLVSGPPGGGGRRLRVWGGGGGTASPHPLPSWNRMLPAPPASSSGPGPPGSRPDPRSGHAPALATPPALTTPPLGAIRGAEAPRARGGSARGRGQRAAR